MHHQNEFRETRLRKAQRDVLWMLKKVIREYIFYFFIRLIRAISWINKTLDKWDDELVELRYSSINYSLFENHGN